MIYGDFETRGVVDLIKLGATRYATDSATQALCFAWTYDNDPEIKLWHRDHPWIISPEPDEELLDRIASGELFEAHNAFFEYIIWNEVLLREYPKFKVRLKREQMRCSAAKASCLSLPRALGDAAKAVNLGQRKMEDGRRLINKLSKPKIIKIKTIDKDLLDLGFTRKEATTVTTEIGWCEEEIEHRRNWEYCSQDVRTERELSNWLPEMTESELEYWQMDWRMNERGVNLDIKAATVAVDLCEKETIRLNAEMQEITGGEVEGGSKRKPFKAWVNQELTRIAEETGAETTLIPDTKADTLSFALHGVPTKAGDEAKAANKERMDGVWETYGLIGERVHRAMEICMEVNRSSNAKYKQMVSSVCPDGRLHDIMLYNGADRTGRWSGKGVQPHNFVRGHKKEMDDVWADILKVHAYNLATNYITMIWGDDPLPTFAKACRGALIASNGMELYAADFNAIEARKLAWMSGCASLLHLFRTGGDPYITMAEAIYKRPLNKKDNPNERNLGKRAVLGLGYAMGWEKFQTTVWNEEGIWLDDEFCQMVVKIYRKDMYPEVPKLWKSVEKAAIAAVVEGGEHYAGGDEFGYGGISYFMSACGNFLHCRLPSGRLLAYLHPEVHTKVTYRFNAINAKGKPCTVSFPAKVGVPANRVRWHAEKQAEKQKKILTNDPPESFTSPHLSFMGRNIVTKQWQRCGTHGGSLVENADQASSRDLLAESMLRVDRTEPFALLLSIHDEVIAEAPIGTATVKEFEALMSEVPKWAPGMPIAAEGWIGPRLRK